MTSDETPRRSKRELRRQAKEYLEEEGSMRNRFRVRNEDPELFAAIQAEQRREVNKKHIKDALVKAVGGVFIGAAIVALALAGTALGALLFLFAWNVGVDGLADAVGASVSNIGFMTAWAGTFVVLFLGSALHGNVPTRKLNRE